MYFGFNNQFIKVKRTLANIYIYIYYVVLVSGIMNLYVKRIPDIKKIFYFDNIEHLGFYLIKIRTSLLRRIFLEL